MIDPSVERRLPLALLLTRLSIVVFLAPWVWGKVKSTDQVKYLFSKYYKVDALPEAVAWGINGLWILLFVLFAVGAFKRFSYGLVFLFHGVGTLFTIPYMIPGQEGYTQLFFAAWPALAAMGLLYMMRKNDTLLAVQR